MDKNLNLVSDQALLEATVTLVSREREVLTSILQHLREIDRRRLYSSLGYRSLFDYATKSLGYSEAQAMRRIDAMRALKELPDLESKISSGALSLTNVSMAQRLFRKEKTSVEKEYSKLEKAHVFQLLENKSAREAEKIVFALSSNPHNLIGDRIRAVSEDHYVIRFVAKDELFRKMEKVRGLLAHSHPALSTAGLLDKLCDMAIDQLDPARKHFRATSGGPPVAQQKRRVINKQRRSLEATPNSTAKTSSKTIRKPTRPYIPAIVRRDVWRRANSKCDGCGSVYALQIDHIVPVAKGGSNLSENLRLLCRSCNQRAAIVELGTAKMSQYLEPPE